MKVVIEFDPSNQPELMHIRSLVAALMITDVGSVGQMRDVPDDDGQIPGKITDLDTGYHTGGPFPNYTAPPAQVLPFQPGTELDASGMPWDERIHSGGKAKTGKGLWKSRKNVDPNLVKTVEAELRARMSANVGSVGNIPSPGPSVLPPMQTVAPTVVLPAPVQHVQTGPQPIAPPAAAMIVPPPMQQQVAAPPPVVEPVGVQWPDILRKLTTAQKNGTYSEQRMDQLLTHWGITGGVAMLMPRTDLYEFLLADDYLGLKNVA